jgi:penicillin amidase
MSSRGLIYLVLLFLGLGSWFAWERIETRKVVRSLPQRQGMLRVKGPTAPATIQRDDRGTPHIRAENFEDAVFALGFAHAQDRLAQMEWMRRGARGRIAEWVGESGLEVDRLARTLAIGALSDAQAERLDASTRKLLEAYCAGVNARLARLRRGEAATPEGLSELPLEDWTPADSIAVVKQWAWGLNGTLESTLVLWDLIERLGGRGAHPFVPPDAAGSLDPLAPLRRRSAARWLGLPAGGSRAGAVAVSLHRHLGLHGRSIGSSAWLVHGSQTASGGAILSGDLHLEATAPGVLYEAHWKGGGRELAGATLPGAPVVWAGHNGHVAWTVTEPRIAVVDLFKETLDSGRPDSYWVGSRLRDLEVREEVISVRGGENVALQVRKTRHGPLIHRLFPGRRQPLAVSWPGRFEGDGLSGLLRAAAAEDAAAFREALRDHHEPLLVFLFADRGGDGGRQLAGFVPRRDPLFPSHLVPVEGRSRDWDWRGRIAYDELPYTLLLPHIGTLVAADERLPNDSRWLIEWWWRDGTRARRIAALLGQLAKEGPVDLRAGASTIQGDTHLDGAERRAQKLLDLAGDRDALPAEGRRLYDALASWDGSHGSENVGAAAWHSLQNQILRMFEQPLGEALFQRYLNLRDVAPERLLDLLIERCNAEESLLTPGIDETLHPITRKEFLTEVRSAFRRAGLELRVRLGPDPARWRWGRLHPLRFRALSPVGTDLGPFPFGGASRTLAVGEYDLAAPYETRVVSGYRIAVDASRPGLALTSFAPGASELPQDPMRVSALDTWLAGRSAVFATDFTLIDEEVNQELVLEPAQ